MLGNGSHPLEKTFGWKPNPQSCWKHAGATADCNFAMDDAINLLSMEEGQSALADETALEAS
jgi:hypothetical protein